MRRMMLVLVACLTLPSLGCVGHHHGHPHGMPPGQAKKLGHVHGVGGGHSVRGGGWVGVSTGSVHVGKKTGKR